MGVHDGHRDRKKDQFLHSGADSFADHELLELLLFYGIPQRDTNPIAHELVDRFGGLRGVFSAAPEDLVEVDYIKKNAAVLIRLVTAIYQRILLSDDENAVIFQDSAQIGEFFRQLYVGQPVEVMYQLCLDAKGKKKGIFRLSEGDLGSVGLNIRQIVENALHCKAMVVVLAHNHPSGLALPSREDQIATRMVREALEAVGVRLADHVIVADNDYVSLAESGRL